MWEESEERVREPGRTEGAHEIEVAPIGWAGATKASVEPSSEGRDERA